MPIVVVQVMRAPLSECRIIRRMNTGRISGDDARFMTTARVHYNSPPPAAGNIVEADVIFTAVEVVTLFDIINFLQRAMGTRDETLMMFD